MYSTPKAVLLLRYDVLGICPQTARVRPYRSAKKRRPHSHPTLRICIDCAYPGITSASPPFAALPANDDFHHLHSFDEQGGDDLEPFQGFQS